MIAAPCAFPLLSERAGLSAKSGSCAGKLARRSTPFVRLAVMVGPQAGVEVN